MEQLKKINFDLQNKILKLANAKKPITMNHFEHHYVDIDTGEEITKHIIQKFNYVKIGKSDSETIRHSYTEKTIIIWHKYRKPKYRSQEIKFGNNT